MEADRLRMEAQKQRDLLARLAAEEEVASPDQLMAPGTVHCPPGTWHLETVLFCALLCCTVLYCTTLYWAELRVLDVTCEYLMTWLRASGY